MVNTYLKIVRKHIIPAVSLGILAALGMYAVAW